MTWLSRASRSSRSARAILKPTLDSSIPPGTHSVASSIRGLVEWKFNVEIYQESGCAMKRSQRVVRKPIGSMNQSSRIATPGVLWYVVAVELLAKVS
jgi:hypothetical protein